jgi:hypothetical protein
MVLIVGVDKALKKMDFKFTFVISVESNSWSWSINPHMVWRLSLKDHEAKIVTKPTPKKTIFGIHLREMIFIYER